MKLNSNNARILKIFLTAFVYLALLSPLFLYSGEMESALDTFVFKRIMGDYLITRFPGIYYTIIAFFALAALVILMLAVNTFFSVKTPPPDVIKVKLKTWEVNASFQDYLMFDKQRRVSLLPGFRSGKAIKIVLALLYFAVSLLPLLEGNNAVTGILTSIPFIVYGMQGILDREKRKTDLILKIIILLLFIIVLSGSIYIIALDINMGSFKSSFSAKTICSAPEVLEKSGINVDAEKFYDMAIVLDPENALPYLKKGMFMEKRGDLKQATLNYRKAVVFDPDGFYSYYRLENIYALDGKNEKALEMFNKVRLRKPDFAPAYYSASKILLESGDIDRANEMIDISISINVNDIDSYRLKARIMTKAKKYREAVQAYNTAIKINPGTAGLYSEKAEALFEMVRLDEAFYNIEKALRLNADDAENYFIKGKIVLVQNKFDNAVKNFKKALKLKPDFILAKGWLALAALESGDSGTAKEEIEAALQNGNKTAELHFIYAFILSESQNYDAALQEIDRAISLDGSQSSYFSLKGEILLRKGDTGPVEGLVAAASKINEKDGYVQYVKGRYFLQAGDFNRAAEAFDRAVELNPYFSRAYAGQAAAASYLDNREKADDSLYSAVTLKPDDYYNYYAKSVIYLNSKRYTSALTSIDKALEMNGNDVELNTLKLKILNLAGLENTNINH